MTFSRFLFAAVALVLCIESCKKDTDQTTLQIRLTDGPGDFQQVNVYSLSYTLFTLSKVYEWIDTAFLILSGKPVIWLHYLHHLTTFSLAASMVSCDDRGNGVDLVSGAALWPSLLNSLVHIVMYAYYCQPDKYRNWRHWITTLQIVQFFLVFAQSPIVLSYTFDELPASGRRSSFLSSHLYAVFCYTLYLVLFLNFCHKQYVSPATDKRSTTKNT